MSRQLTVPSPKFHTIQCLAKDLEVSEITVRRWLKSGELVAHRLGRQWRISNADLELFLRQRRGLNLPNCNEN